MRTLMGTMVQIIGAVALVSSVLPWFLIAVSAILIFYYWIALYYRSAARDIKVFLCTILVDGETEGFTED